MFLQILQFIIIKILYAQFILCSTDYESSEEADLSEFNIQTDVFPLNYNIELEVTSDLTKYDGNVKIDFISRKTSSALNIHASLDSINGVQLINKNKVEVIDDFTYKKIYYNFLSLRHNNSTILERNNFYEVELNFSNKINELYTLEFFRSSYDIKNGNTSTFAATSFYPKFLKYAIPCFDDISLKSSFDLRITHPKNYTAYSNMPGYITEETNETTTTTFEKSPRMSPHSFAFIIGDFGSKKIPYNGKTNMTIYTNPEKLQYIELAANWSGIILETLEKYLNVRYLLPNLNQFVFPVFLTVPVQNNGLITYSEEVLLYNPKTDSIRKREKILKLISQGFVFQYFSNVVTTKKWMYDWISGGFAEYLNYIVLDIIFPEERYLDQYCGEKLYSSINSDHGFVYYELNPKLTYVSEYDEPNEFKYERASAIIRMIHHAITDTIFKNTLTNYLNRFKFSSVTPDDLTDEIKKSVEVANQFPEDVDVVQFIRSWSYQSGFPYLNINRNYQNDEVEISQSHISWINEDVDRNRTWIIPYNYATKLNPNFNDTKPMGWLKNVNSTKILIDVSSVDWIVFNIQQTGYYIVNYDQHNWNLIIKELVNDNLELIHPVNRAFIMQSAYVLAKNGKLEYDILFEILLYLRREIDPVPWMVAFQIFNELELKLQETKYQDALKLIVLNGVINLYDFYGSDKKSSDTSIIHLTRILGIKYACEYGYQKCIKDMEMKSNKLFSSLKNNEEIPFDPDLLEQVYCNGFKNEEVYNELWQFGVQSQDETQKFKIFDSIKCHRNTKLFRKYYIQIMGEIKYKTLPDHNESDLNYITDLIYRFDSILILDILNQCVIENCFDVSNPLNEEATIEIIMKGIRLLAERNMYEKLLDERVQALRNSVLFLDQKFNNSFTKRLNDYGNQVIMDLKSYGNYYEHTKIY